MKSLLYAGHELLTTDEVADALLDYVVTLPLNQPPERLVIPAIRDGQPIVVEVVVTASTPIASATTEVPSEHLDGETEALREMKRKTNRIAHLGLDLR